MASKKGTQGKNASSSKASVSRHSTPLTDALPSTPTPITTPAPAAATPMAKETPYLKTSIAALVNNEPSIEALIEKSNASVSKPGDPPNARHLHELHDKIAATVNKFMSKRGETCDRSMRQLVQRRKERLQEEREQEAARESERARVKKEEERAARKGKDKDKDKDKTPGKKRTHDEMDADDDEKERKERRESLPSVGAHGVARQDGVGVHQGADAPPSPLVQPGTVAPDLMDTANSPSDSDTSRSDPPSTAPLYERIFGKDPTAPHDPILYHIPEIHDDMSHEEKREILQVAQWPESDLHDLIAGDPPDKDFSNAKPANQVNFSTFATYVEPYIRAFTEEDVAFLKERGDRTTPYLMPLRGAKEYKEVWAAEEDDAGIVPPKRLLNNPNEARGSIEDMEDDIADQDTVSLGPVMSRLLSVVRPQPSSVAKKDDTEDTNGDISMVNGDDDPPAPLQNGTVEDQKPATYFPPDYPKVTAPSPDYQSLDDRLLKELVYMGFLDKTETPSYDMHNDDEVAARLRTLQDALRTISRQNNVRKARVLELTEERMAMQEYSNIADDLDNQVNAAYLKRNRSLAKPNQKKGSSHANRPGQKGVASAPAGRGVSDGVRALMQKRRDWIDMVGPVVGYGRPPIPEGDETIFDEANYKRLEKLEKEAEAGEVEAE